MAHERSLTELRRDADNARAGFAQAVDEIRARTSRAGLIDRLARSVQDNPLQAAALGVSVAYPVLKACRAVPAPLLMIGAGLFLSSTSAGKSASRKATEFGADITDKAAGLATAITKTATESANSALAAARDAANAASASLDAAKEKAQAFAGASAEQANRAVHAASTAQAELSSRAAGALNDAWAQAPSKEQMTRIAERARRATTAAIDRNPLALGGVGLAIGALLASALPPSAAENQLVGDASDRVKDRARETASQQFEAAKDAAQAAFRSAAERAEQEGLTTDEMRATVEEYAQRARKVAGEAVAAAAQAQADKPH
jgi:hypothetical protein